MSEPGFESEAVPPSGDAGVRIIVLAGLVVVVAGIVILAALLGAGGDPDRLRQERFVAGFGGSGAWGGPGETGDFDAVWKGADVDCFFMTLDLGGQEMELGMALSADKVRLELLHVPLLPDPDGERRLVERFRILAADGSGISPGSPWWKEERLFLRYLEEARSMANAKGGK